MGSVRKIAVGLLFLMVMAAGALNLYAELINVEGEMESSVTAYLTRRFSSYSETKNLTFRMYLPPTQTEGLNTQTISRLRKSFTPFPTETVEFIDEFGNSGIDLIWNKQIHIIQTDLQFSAQVYSNFYEIESKAPFPVVIEDQQRIFLTSTELSPSNDFMINYIGRAISYGLNREIDVVKNVFIWVDKNIHLSNISHVQKEYDAISVLKMKAGDERGICNLAAAIFKGIGIPVRVVYGISFQQEISVAVDGMSFVNDYPNDEKYWLEVYFPDLGWISYDPQGTYFGTTSHLIKFSVGPDSDYATNTWQVEQGDIIDFKEYIYDIKSDNSSLTMKGFGDEEVNKIVMSSTVIDFNRYTKEPELDFTEIITPQETAEIPIGEKGIVAQNSDMNRLLDIVATQKRVYAQKFNATFPFNLVEVRLPLIKFSDEGRIWLEIYSDDGGVPGEVLFKTFSIHSPRVRFMMVDNPWLSFPVGKKTNTFLDKGSYWIALRSSGSCIFNWHANGGNLIGDSDDTRFKDVSLKNPQWNNIMNFDLIFQIIGTREEERTPEG